MVRENQGLQGFLGDERVDDLTVDETGGVLIESEQGLDAGDNIRFMRVHLNIYYTPLFQNNILII